MYCYNSDIVILNYYKEIPRSSLLRFKVVDQITSKELGRKQFKLHRLVEQDFNPKYLWVRVPLSIKSQQHKTISVFIELKILLRAEELREKVDNYRQWQEAFIYSNQFVRDPVYYIPVRRSSIGVADK